ncbi:unnamed protein product [Coffea canephora]|uniref:Uncharacterized protein n=1 Tax=Coffea canephora TaxID=49390 RepID=A0A068TZR4_COFCA|nr:unnamed protein product [Coffea canephora]
MEISWLLMPFLAWLAAAVLLSRITSTKRPKKNYRPGPKPWPIIGNLHLIDSQPHRSFHSLYHKYGGIMPLWFGGKPLIVASTPEAAKEFLKNHDYNFSSRPANAAGKYIIYNYSDVTWAPTGDKHLFRYTLTIITRTVLGKTYISTKESNDDSAIVTFEELTAMLDKWFVLNGVLNIGDWVPWHNVFDLRGYVKQMKEVDKDYEKFFNFVLEDHKARTKAEKDFVPRDMVDILLNLAEDPNLEVKLSRESVKGLIQDLLLGGTDTSTTTVEFVVTALVKHPHLTEKVTEELDRVVGRDRWVEEDDFPKLPFLEAVVKETFRCYPLCTLLAPRFAMEDCKVAGYNVYKGTTVLVNAWSIGRDPNYWDSPEEFLPERFLEKDIDIKGQNFEPLAFGSSRRRCAGYALGLKAVRSMLSNLLHGFNLKLPDGTKPEDVCMDEVYGFTTHPKVPIKLILEPRLRKDLYT